MFNYLHEWNGSTYTSLNYPNDRSEGVVEDSQGRLWSLGEYYNLKYYSNNMWTPVPFTGWGYSICKDPTRPGTIWASSGNQVLRTDGNYNFTRYNTSFSELNPQSDILTTVVAAPDGIAWLGSNQGLFRLNANNGSYQFYSPSNSQIPGDNISPLIVTPDGRLWFSNFWSTTTSTYGLCWFDGINFGIIPQTQTGGLPHAQIYDIEMNNIDEGYELWISCASRGIAVLTIITDPVDIEVVAETMPVFYLDNYPNPFHENTSISFQLPEESKVRIDIYDMNGRIVKNITEKFFSAGASTVVWNGKDNQSNRVKPGTYVCRMVTGSFSGAIGIIVY